MGGGQICEGEGEGTAQKAIAYTRNDPTWVRPPSDAYLDACCYHLLPFWPTLDHSGALAIYDSRCISRASHGPLFAVPDLNPRPPKPEEMRSIFLLEEMSYPEDEAASLEQLHMRATQAPECFQVTIHEDIVVGFVNGTRMPEGPMSEESMSVHHTDGTILCIHSVVVQSAYQRKGCGKALVRLYLKHIRENVPIVKEVKLLCKPQLRGFYRECGFEDQGVSAVVHGSSPWHEMSLKINP